MFEFKTKIIAESPELIIEHLEKTLEEIKRIKELFQYHAGCYLVTTGTRVSFESQMEKTTKTSVCED